MHPQFSDAELESYLDEALDPRQAAEIELAARRDKKLLTRLALINRRRDAGVHTLGEIWRRNQIAVPTREQMADFLLGVLDTERADYIQFRLDVLKCPFTQALKTDLTRKTAKQTNPAEKRCEKIYESSAGFLKKPE